MRQVKIERDPSEESGTFGVLTAGMFRCYSLELPWRNNEPEKSCIPPGTYRCEIIDSPRFGRVYEVRGVKDRTHILIHKGNLAGDRDLGLKSDVEGCILIGNAIGELAGQRALLNSRDAFARFMAEMDGEAFDLVVKWA